MTRWVYCQPVARIVGIIHVGTHRSACCPQLKWLQTWDWDNQVQPKDIFCKPIPGGVRGVPHNGGEWGLAGAIHGVKLL